MAITHKWRNPEANKKSKYNSSSIGKKNVPAVLQFVIFKSQLIAGLLQLWNLIFLTPFSDNIIENLKERLYIFTSYVICTDKKQKTTEQQFTQHLTFVCFLRASHMQKM